MCQAREWRTVTSPARRPTIFDVAERAGVSTATVSHVLNRPERVAASTRTRVAEVIAELGFVRNASARQLSDGRSRAVGLVVLDANPFNTEIARGVEDALKPAGYVVIVCNSAGSKEREEENVRLLEEQRVGGVLMTPVATSRIPALDRLRASGTPVVLVDHRGGNESCSVSVNDVVGGRLAARHLYELGHRQVGIVNGPSSIQPNAERRKGFIEALRKEGIDVKRECDLQTDVLRVEAGEEAGEHLLSLRHPPRAVFCGNDLLAIGVLRATLAHGLSVPEDIAIVGYDDVVFAELATVPLTSVRQPIYELGYSAANLLLKEIRDAQDGIAHSHERLVFKPELVVRESTALPTSDVGATRPPDRSRRIATKEALPMPTSAAST